MKVAGLEQYDQANEICDTHMAGLLAAAPEMIFAVPSDPETAICIVEQYDAYTAKRGNGPIAVQRWRHVYLSVVTETSG